MKLEEKYIDKYSKTKTDMKKIIFIGFILLFSISCNIEKQDLKSNDNTQLIDLIERYELYKYDNIVLKKKNKKYKVRRGDTLYSISEKFNMPVEALVKLNNLNGDILKVGQTLMIKK